MSPYRTQSASTCTASEIPELLRFFARSCSFPSHHTYKILNNRYTEDLQPTAPQRRFLVIASRIQMVLNVFRISHPNIIPSPPLSSFFLQQIKHIDFLFTDKKTKITKEEAQQLFFEYKEEHQADAYIYTDGSRKDGHSAAAITSQNYEKTNRLHDSHSIFSAELIAISSARYVSGFRPSA